MGDNLSMVKYIVLLPFFALPANILALTSDPLVVNLGILNATEERIINLSLVNDSPFPESITDIHASCGCTSFELKGDKIVKPGEKRTLSIRINNKDIFGPRKIDVVLLTKEKSTPLLLSLIGYSINSEGVNILKTYLDFGELDVGETKTKHLSILGTKTALNELRIKGSNPGAMHVDLSGNLEKTEYDEIYKVDTTVTISRLDDTLPSNLFATILRNDKQIGKVSLAWARPVFNAISQRTLSLGRIKNGSSAVIKIDLPSKIHSEDIDIATSGALFVSSVKDVSDEPTSLTLTVTKSEEIHGIASGQIILQKKSVKEKLLTVDWVGYFE